MDINNGYDRHLEPPDEPEAEFCEDCGKEMAWIRESFLEGGGYNRCVYQFCPSKFEGLAKEMAEKIVEQEDTIERLENRVKFLARKLQRMENKNEQ